MKKSRACFADGGQISKADQLIAEMNAKYGVSGNSSAPAPVAQQPAVQQPEPKPQSKGLIGDAMNIFSNRAKQIDKAAGYANGGKIGEPFEAYSKRQYAEGFRQNIEGVRTNYETFGRGDSSAKMQRRLDNYSDAAHESVAKANREADNSTYRETRGAARYANGGLIEGIGTPTSDSIPARVRETGEDIAVSTKERIVSHEQDKLLQRLAKAMGFDSVDAFFEAGTGKPVGPTIKGGKRAAENGADLKKPWYMQDPLTALSSSIEKSMNASQAAEDYNKSLYPAGTFDSATKPTPQQSATGNPLSSVSPTYQQSRPGASDVGLAGIGNKPSTASTADNQFTQGGKNYTVNPTSQEGISKVTARGTSPLYTNINPEQAVSGMKNQMIGGDAASVNEGLSRYANANKITGEMIANRDKDIPAGGYAPGILGDGGVEAANAEKTQRWRQDDLLRLATRGNQAAIGALLNSDGHRDVAAMNNETSRQNAGVAAQRESNRDQVTMRGQDLNAQNELLRLQGNPLDNQTKQLALGQAQKIAQLQDKAANGDAGAIKELQLRNPKEPNYSNRYTALPNIKRYNDMGQVIGEEPGGMFDNMTGTAVGNQQQTGSQQATAPKAGEVRGGYRFKGGNPADKASWEKA